MKKQAPVFATMMVQNHLCNAQSVTTGLASNRDAKIAEIIILQKVSVRHVILVGILTKIVTHAPKAGLEKIVTSVCLIILETLWFLVTNVIASMEHV